MDKLCFCSAAFGSWGIVRLGTLVPECHMLFVCPYSCGRHNSIGAVQHGYKDKISYLFIDEKDLALGTIEEDIHNAVGDICNSLSKKPKVMLIYFSCVLYMSGLDFDACIAQLNEKCKGITFCACMMNPVAGDTKRPPVPAMISTLCSLFDVKSSKTNTVNLLGCYSKLDSENELASVLFECGAGDLLHFTDTDTFENYKKMGESCLNIVIRPEGLLAAKDMQKDIPYLFLPVSYDIEEVKRQYAEIFDFFGKTADISGYIKKAEESIKKTKEMIGSAKIAISSSAVCRPFSLARALLRSGFNVTDVFYETCPFFETQAKNEIADKVTFHDVHDPGYAQRIGSTGDADIAIGYTAGYYTGSEHTADLMIDEGMFGFGGIIRLMQLIIDAAKAKSDVKSMIDAYGLIV